MKKFISLLLSAVVITSLVACGEKNKTSKEIELDNTKTTTEVQIEATTATTIPTNEISTAQTSEQYIVKEENNLNNDSLDNSNDEAWRQFLKDYEAWVDKYVEFMKKYKQNPTDMTLLSEYSEFLKQTVEWSEKAEKYENDLKNASPKVLTEYLETLSRISKKITEIAY